MRKEQLDSIRVLWEAVDQSILPWACDLEAARCIVGMRTYREFTKQGAGLPAGIRVERRPWRGKPKNVPKKLQRLGSKMATHIWPDDGLLTMAVPKLAYILEGRSDFRLGDYTLDLPAGHFIAIPPGVPHPDGSRGHTDGPGSCAILWLTLWSDVLYCWICRSQDEQHLPRGKSEACFVYDPQVNSYLYALTTEAMQQEPGYDNVCRDLNRVIWTVLHRRMAAGQFMMNAKFQAGQELPAAMNQAPIQQAQQYVRSHLNERLTLSSVGQQVHLSRAQFARRFHEEAGQTFNTFVTQCRLQEACRLLEETSWSISIISEVTGLTAVHLRELFRRHFGQSPSEFRARCAEKNETIPSEMRRYLPSG